MVLRANPVLSQQKGASVEILIQLSRPVKVCCKCLMWSAVQEWVQTKHLTDFYLLCTEEQARGK